VQPLLPSTLLRSSGRALPATSFLKSLITLYSQLLHAALLAAL
jgi:hypothetical protein